MNTLMVSGHKFQVNFSPCRKTIGITVRRGGVLRIAAPQGCPSEQLIHAVNSKMLWIKEKLTEQRRLLQPSPKQYADGESFYVFGRVYRLRIVAAAQSQRPPLSLDGQWFHLREDCLSTAALWFRRWYRHNGLKQIEAFANPFAHRVQADLAGIRISDLGYRWGSCGANRVLNFHWRVVGLPLRIIEYVVAHEISHLIQNNHGKLFWRLVEQLVPDYIDRRRWLDENGGRF